MGALALVVAGLIVAAGVILFARARWPRRRGNETRCGRCEYELTGLDLNAARRCPECGRGLAERNVVYGSRRISRRGMAAGGVLALAGGIWLTHLISRGATFGFVLRYAPTPILLSLMDHADWATGNQAADIVHSRLTAGNLSQNQIEWFIDSLLALKLDARSRIAIGDELPVRIRIRPRFLCVRGYRIETQEVRIDKRVIPAGPGLSESFGALESSLQTSHAISLVAAGPHVIEKQMRFSLLPAGGSGGTPLGSVTRKLSATFEVTTAHQTVGVRSSAALDELIKKGVSLTSVVRGDGWGLPDVNGIGFQVEFSPNQPIDQCYGIFVEANGKEFAAGQAAVAKGNEIGARAYCRVTVASGLPESVSIVLRANPREAGKHVDLTEIWDGEIRFDGVVPRSTLANNATFDRVYSPTAVTRSHAVPARE
jgi:hypothetical protein